jgi:hypothetical protein
MAIDATTRPAKDTDADFAWHLYSSFVGPALGAYFSRMPLKHGWNAETEKPIFREVWEPRRSLIIEADSEPIGWLAVDGRENIVRLENFHLLEKYRGSGLGTAIVDWMFKQHEGRAVLTTTIVGTRSATSQAASGM